MTGITYRHDGQIWVDENYDGSGVSYNVTATRNGLLRLASHFAERQILLLDDEPTGGDLHIRDQLRRMRIGNLSDLSLAAEDYSSQRATYEAILFNIATELHNARYRPVFTNLCDEQFCPLFDGKTLLYRNGDHLSWEGALGLTANARGLLKH
jgi:hypothetical protein